MEKIELKKLLISKCLEKIELKKKSIKLNNRKLPRPTRTWAFMLDQARNCLI